MLEISDYRLGEQLGRSTISNWRIAETHLVDHFIRVGFPVRIDSRHYAPSPSISRGVRRRSTRADADTLPPGR